MKAPDFKQHLLLPLLVFSFALGMIEHWQLDLRLASQLFDLQGGNWQLRHDPLFADVLHTGARNFLVCVYIGLLLIWLGLFLWRRHSQAQRALGYVLCSALVSALIVSAAKHLTHMDCPWDLQMFGGERPYISLWSGNWWRADGGACFPAGHASAGYAWLGCYFVCRRYWPRWRYGVLAAVMMLGLLLGGVQQLRGAHFISHDLWTLAISWCCALLLYPCMLGHARQA